MRKIQESFSAYIKEALLSSIFKIYDSMSKIYYLNYFRVIILSLEFVQHYMQRLHGAAPALSLLMGSSVRVLLHRGEQRVETRKGSAGLAGRYPTMSNKESRAGPEMVMVTRVSRRAGIAR